jgi:hypothetical protein
VNFDILVMSERENVFFAQLIDFQTLNFTFVGFELLLEGEILLCLILKYLTG